MNSSYPQILYIILVVPGLFGLALVGEGISKISGEKKGGAAFIVFGLLFIGLVAFTFIFLSDFLVGALN